MRRIVGGRKPVPGVRPAHRADDLDRPGDLAVGPRRRVLAAFGHEAAIDDDDAAVGKPRRREHPIAGAGDIGAEADAAAKTSASLPLSNVALNVTRRYSSLAGSSSGQAAGGGSASGGAASRSVSAAIKPSFQALRSICQVPSATRIAKASSAGTSSPSHERRALRRRGSSASINGHRLRRRNGLPRPCDGIAARSSGPSSAAAARA